MRRIEEDYDAAVPAHEERLARYEYYYRLWRNLSDGRTDSDGRAPFHVPLLEWQLFGKWAKEIDSLLGDDAEITAEAIGPSDSETAHKVAKFQEWRVFNYMKLTRPAAQFSFQKLIYGKVHAYAPWRRETYEVPLQGGSSKEEVAYDAPGFEVLKPDDFITPGEDVQNVDQFSFVLRKFWASPDDLLRGAESGLYGDIDDALFERIVRESQVTRRRDHSDRIKRTADEAEGVDREGINDHGGQLRVWAWYGRWRKLRGRKDAAELNLKQRERFESDMVVYFLPDLRVIIGCQDLAEMYPVTKKRRPFLEGTMVQDGTYWSKGYGEMLAGIQEQMTSAHWIGDKAGRLSCGPVIFYSPDSGLDPDTIEIEPNTAIATTNPKGINVVGLKADLEYPVMVNQEMAAIAERLTGVNDSSAGRQTDRPNAPRTARQFIGLIEEGNVRASLDVKMVREDWADIIQWFWDLEIMYGSPKTFFRVTEKRANGLFLTEKGGAYITAAERGGRYDFKLKLATSRHSKEAEKEQALALYELDMKCPLIVSNPRALWVATERAHRAMGDERFADMVPMPPDIQPPRMPDEEWAMLLQGDKVMVHPMDQDEQHIQEHYAQAKEHREAPGDIDEQALQGLAQHIADHQGQLAQKRLMQTLVSQIGGAAQALGAAGGEDPNAATA